MIALCDLEIKNSNIVEIIDELIDQVYMSTKKNAKSEQSPQWLSEVDIFGIAQQMADNAWYGKERDLTFFDLKGTPVLSFQGHVYEPGYESFSATCAIYGYSEKNEKITLFDEDDYSAGAYHHEVRTTGSKELVGQYAIKHDVLVRKEKIS